MALDQGLDTGPIYESIPVEIAPSETAAELTMRLGDLGTGALIARLAAGLSGIGSPTPQVGDATYAEKLSVEDRHLDFSKSALECLRVVRIGRAWTSFRDNRLIVHAAHLGEAPGAGIANSASNTVVPGWLEHGTVVTGDGALVLDVVQLAGRAPQGFLQFANGAQPSAGEILG